jgi:transcriptional regulator with XRE-family HTH domain
MQILRDYMALTGMNQGELARRIGITDNDLSNLLLGKRNPGLKVLVRMNEATGIKLDRLVLGGIPANGQGDAA